jgi:type III pantothenate kinase
VANILALDVENTIVAVGVFKDGVLAHHWQVSTAKNRTPDEIGILIKSLCRDQGFDVRHLHGAVISSVVPPVTPILEDMCKKYLGCSPVVVAPGIKTGIVINYENPRDVGADRIANAVAAVRRYGPPVIVVDLRTATTFTVVNSDGHYIGGVIAPGIRSSAEAMFQHTAKLPKIDLVAPRKVIGKNTVAAMQSGIVYGFAGLIDNIVQRIRDEVPLPYQVVGTGEFAGLVCPHTQTVKEIVPHLTLEGLRILWEQNR